jgi:hypothetical protein
VHVEAKSAEWYEIGNFWVAVIAVLIAILLAALTVWATYRLSYPRRRLVLIDRTRRVLPTDPAWGAVTMSDADRKLADPYLVDLGLGNDGRRTIPGDLFDLGRPIVIDLGRPVLFVHHSTRKVPRRGRLRTTSPAMSPDVKADGTTVRVGPGMLAPLQLLEIVAVVDGAPALACRSSLKDVPEVSSAGVKSTRARVERTTRFALFAVGIVAIAVPLALRVSFWPAITLVAVGVAAIISTEASARIARRVVGPALAFR